MHLTDGSVSTPECAVMAPANEANELDTVLLLGRVGADVDSISVFQFVNRETAMLSADGNGIIN